MKGVGNSGPGRGPHLLNKGNYPRMDEMSLGQSFTLSVMMTSLEK